MTVHRPHRHVRQFLLVIDHDNERYTIEGPIFDNVPWTREIESARRAGRQIDFRIIPTPRVTAVMNWGVDLGYEQWPEKSIINPLATVGSSSHNSGI